jgi:hypothetical protein
MPCTEIVMIGPCNALGPDSRVAEQFSDTVYEGNKPRLGSHNLKWPQKSLYTQQTQSSTPTFWLDWKQERPVGGFAIAGHDLDPGDTVTVDLYSSAISVPIVGRRYGADFTDLVNASSLFESLTSDSLVIQFQIERYLGLPPTPNVVAHFWAFDNSGALDRQLLITYNQGTGVLQVDLLWSGGTAESFVAPAVPIFGANFFAVAISSDATRPRCEIFRNSVSIATFPGAPVAGQNIFPCDYGRIGADRLGANSLAMTLGELRLWAGIPLGDAFSLDGCLGYLRPSQYNQNLEAYFKFQDKDSLLRNEIESNVSGVHSAFGSLVVMMGQLAAPPAPVDTLTLIVPTPTPGTITGCGTIPCCPGSVTSLDLFGTEQCVVGARVAISKAALGSTIGRFMFGPSFVFGDEDSGIVYGRLMSYDRVLASKNSLAGARFRRQTSSVRTQKFTLENMPDDEALRVLLKQWALAGQLSEVVFWPRPDIAGYEDLEIIHGQLAISGVITFISAGRWTATFDIREWG